MAQRTNNIGVISMQYFVLDHLGSTVALTDASAAIIEHDFYDPYGKRRTSGGGTDTACAITSATTRGFSGHEMMDSVCLTNMNGRVYDQTLGRFTSADSVTFDPGNGQDLNAYAYVNDRPTVLSDPTGLFRTISVPSGGSGQTQPTDGKGEVVTSTADKQQQNEVDLSIGDLGSFGQVNGGLTPGVNEIVVVTAQRLKRALTFTISALFPTFWINAQETKQALCAAAPALGDHGRARLGADAAVGLGAFDKAGFGASLRGDGSIEFDAYDGGGAGLGVYAGAGVSGDNAGGTDKGFHFALSKDITAAVGVPVYGPIGVGGSVTIPLNDDTTNGISTGITQVQGGLGVGPRYGAVVGISPMVATVTYRTGSICH